MAETQLGNKVWIIPDGFIPVESKGELQSHEAICILNCNKEEAKIDIAIYFEEQEPIEEIPVSLAGKRTKHIVTNDLEKNGVHIPKGQPYAMKVTSDIPIVVQHSRMDATQAENALMSTMAYPAI